MTSSDRKISLIDTGVGSVMTKQVKTIEGSRPLLDCVKIMRDSNIGSLVVVEEGKPIGIFTERDLIRKTAEGPESLGAPMVKLMSQPLTTISTTATIWDAITLMGRLNIRHLPAVQNGKLVGILTERDVLRLILAQQSLLLESVSESLPATTREQLAAMVGRLGIERPPARMKEGQ